METKGTVKEKGEEVEVGRREKYGHVLLSRSGVEGPCVLLSVLTRVGSS